MANIDKEDAAAACRLIDKITELADWEMLKVFLKQMIDEGSLEREDLVRVDRLFEACDEDAIMFSEHVSE